MILGSALGLAVVALAGWGLFGRGGNGSLPHRHPHVTYNLFPMSPKDTSFSLGAMHLREPGKQVQVVSVKALTSANVEYIDAFTVWPKDWNTSALDVGPGFPSPDQPHRHPLTEVVPATDSTLKTDPADNNPLPISVVLGFRVRSGDIGAVNGVQVNYRVDGEMRHQYFSYAVIGCVEPNPCHAPGNGDSQRWWDRVFYSLGLAPKP
jgi:hypothetical protein